MEIIRQYTSSGHRSSVYTLATGRDNRQVLSAGGDGRIVEWNLDHPETGNVLATVETQVFALLAFPGQSRVVAGDMNGGVHWIDPDHPEQTRNIQHHHKGVYDIRASGAWLYTAGGDGILTRWAVDEARAVESVQLSAQALRTVAISLPRSEIAVGSSDGAIYFLDLETMALKNTLPGAHDNSVFTLAFSRNQRYLLSGGRDAMLRVWDLENRNAPVSEQAAHWYTINHLVFSPDGRLFATASRDKTIKIWDSETFELLKVVDTIRHGAHVRSVNHLLWLPEYLISASDDQTLMWWEIN